MLKKFTTDFTVTPNRIINHPKMSLKAKGIWTFLNSKPQNWNFSVKGMTTQNKDGEDGITSGMKELEKFRFLKRVPRKDESGQWNGYDYHLTDVPFEKVDDQPSRENPETVIPPVPGKTGTGKTGDGKSPTLSKEETSKKDLSKKEETPVLKIDFQETVDLPTMVLNYLNDVRDSSRGYDDTLSNLSDIKSRIKEKYKLEDFKKVIDHKNNQWKNDPKMKKYIRPSTLFGSKFNEYLVEAETKMTSSDGSQNFKFNPSQKADLK